MLKQINQFKSYLLGSFAAEIKYQYAGTVLGTFWFIINPLLEVAIYSVVFSQIISLRSGGNRDISYVYFLMSGLFPWLVFSTMLIKGSGSLAKNAVYLRRLAIPTWVFVAKEALITLFTLCIYMIILIPVSYLSLGTLSNSLVAMPLIGVFLILMGFGLTLSLSHIQVMFPDVAEIIGVIVSLWRWTLPIMFTIDTFPEPLKTIFQINPPYYLIDSFHSIILEGKFPSLSAWGYIFSWSLVFLYIGWKTASRLELAVKENL